MCLDLLSWMDPSPDSVCLVFGPDPVVGPDNTVARWDVLVPQVVWLGTNFTFLPVLFPALWAPSYTADLAPR